MKTFILALMLALTAVSGVVGTSLPADAGGKGGVTDRGGIGRGR